MQSRFQQPEYQGRNEVYAIRDQRPKMGWDLGSQALGSGSAVFQGIRDQVILDNNKNYEMCFTQEIF